MEDKLQQVLRHFLSLHEADAIALSSGTIIAVSLTL